MSDHLSAFVAEIPRPETARKGLFKSVLLSMRPHQWVKNLFVFAPLLFGQRLADLNAIGMSCAAFAVFSLLSSSLYIINDCVDAAEDRLHPEKSHRPISSGELSIPIAVSISVVLLICVFSVASWIGLGFLAITVSYFFLVLCYCLWFKRLIVMDCMVIASGFVLRVVGGAIAISVVPSHWLIACAFLLALFLAFSKRRQEMLTLSAAAMDHRKVLGQYSITYLEQVNTILIAASVVAYALYTVAPETIERFGTDALIYGTVFVIYGMFRYLALINDPKLGGNPSKMLLRDHPLMITVVVWGFYNAAVIYRSLLWPAFEHLPIFSR